MTGGCTIGAKIVGDRYLLFKNRDLVYDNYKDQCIFEDDVFAVIGIKIGAGIDMGASIGVNRWGLAACNSTVLINSEEAYDVLMKRLLRSAKTLDEAYDIVVKSLDSGERYQWGNFVIATPDEVGAIEIGDGVCEIEHGSGSITRTNHHLILPTRDALLRASPEEREAGGPLSASQTRRQIAARMLESARSTQDIIEILSTHAKGKGYDSICRHKTGLRGEDPLLGETSYSYIIEVETKPLDFRIYVAPGNPCSTTYHELQLDFEASSDAQRKLVSDFP
ncbi:MAG: carcinine hydrolase/isopenicillin-N N-acyltransferase family protein [Candidatus Thorarchaeota archaeon]